MHKRLAWQKQDLTMRIEGYIEKYLQGRLSHAETTEKLAMQIYEKLRRQKQIPELPKLLGYGALLHDIGMCISPLEHNKIGANIIIRDGIEGLSEDEVYVVACLVRYHRGGTPKKTHKKYSVLNKDLQNTVKIYSSIIRLADALDWKHKNFIDNIDIKIDKNNAVLTLHGKTDIIMKSGFLKFFGKKKEYFEKVFKLSLTLKTSD